MVDELPEEEVHGEELVGDCNQGGGNVRDLLRVKV